MASSGSARLLLVIMLVLLAGGVWIAMTLAIVGWVGQAFFTDHAARQEPVLAPSGKANASLGAGGAAAVHLDGRDPVPHAAVSEQMFEGLAPWLEPRARAA